MVRLLVLLGLGVAAYLVLSLFDHAARADTGPIDPVASVKATIASGSKAASVKATVASGSKAASVKATVANGSKTASVKATVAGGGKAAKEAKSIIPKDHRPAIKPPLKIHPPKIKTPSIRADKIVRRVQVRASKLRLTASDAVRKVVAVPLELPHPPQAQIPAWPKLPSWPQPPGLPKARTTVLPASAPVLQHQPIMPPVSAQISPIPQSPAFVPAPGLSGVTKPPAAQAQPRTTPLPASPRQPADHSTPNGQARDSGGGSAPAMDTASSSWRPEVAAGGRRPTTDLLARGRTLRYAGPPS